MEKTETSSSSGDLRERGASSSAWRVVQGKVPVTDGKWAFLFSTDPKKMDIGGFQREEGSREQENTRMGQEDERASLR